MLKVCKYCLLLFVYYSCSQEATNLNNIDLLFPNSLRLNVPAYSYDDSLNTVYTVMGDTTYYTGIPDTLNSTPVLRWDSLGLNNCTAAIFTAKPVVAGGMISNSNDIVWQWHSGMNSEEFAAHANFSDGRNMVGDADFKSIDYGHKPTPLTKGREYYWAVWSWTSDGINILFSTRVMRFYVPG
jgi:hypothetical protein